MVEANPLSERLVRTVSEEPLVFEELNGTKTPPGSQEVLLMASSKLQPAGDRDSE